MSTLTLQPSSLILFMHPKHLHTLRISAQLTRQASDLLVLSSGMQSDTPQHTP